MAEKNEETPENETPETIVDEVASAGEAGRGDERSEAVASTEAEAPDVTEPTAEQVRADKPSSKGGPTRSEKLEAKRAERRAAAGKRPSRTPEERNRERLERRAKLAKERRAYRARTKAKQAEARKAAPPREPDHAPEHGPGRAKTRQGIVVSDKGEKTITVAIDVVRRHKRYHKILRSTVKLYAHDERNDAHPGDTVRVVECRPMSRSKRWRLVEVVERAR
jgi:small subunit ribosomal protein S17